jgi:hypothetical protein
LWTVRTYAQTFSLIIGAFYLWASVTLTPDGHFLNWSEFHAVAYHSFNQFMSAIYAGGCGQ